MSLTLLQGSLDNINLFSIITILAFFLLLPLTLVTEGVKLTPAYLEAAVSARCMRWCSCLLKRALSWLHAS